MNYLEWMSPEWAHVLFVLFLSFLIGLEREERKGKDDRYSFGGVRTFPLIGLIGYSMGLLSGGELLPQAIGFAVIAGFLMISYWHKLSSYTHAGVTSEMSGLTTYLVGTFVYHEMFWIATALTVSSLLLLELKEALESLARRIEGEDILTFTKFLLLTSVILPLLPNTPLTQFEINPFKTWLVVVAVSAVSYGSYVIQSLTKGQGGLILTAILGGTYSSTVTTVALARMAKTEDHPHLFSGAILIASGMMYLRLIVLLALFNRALMNRLALPFFILAMIAIGVGWFWSRRSDISPLEVNKDSKPKNPLEISAAVFFALLFVGMLVATHLTIHYLGNSGVYTLASIMGVTDVDPFILGLTQATPLSTPLNVAAYSIMIAASSNNAVKGIYAFALSTRQTGIESLRFLLALAALGLVPLFW
ncbi:MgtC family protein [mine drainage metagenome]|uniref:MgtC family protein n=1 Tax=mine drainage metagenome TaxID=410659 RepID=A0A1J5SJZ8_9ZZZZ